MARRLVLFLLVLVFGGAVGAIERSPESGQTTVLTAPWGYLYCTPGCKYVNGPGERVTVATASGTVRAARAGDWTIVQFPGHTARVRQDATGDILVQFRNRNYRLLHKTRELQLVLPDDTITYTLSNGAVKSILGKSSQVLITRNTPKHQWGVSSEAGTSLFVVKSAPLAVKGKKFQKDHRLSLGLLDGLSADQHPYLYRGLRFEDGGVGIYIPLKAGPFLAAMPWKNCLVVGAPAAAADDSAGPDVINGQAPASRSNPLQADPPKEGTLKATTAEGNPLKADTGKPGEQPLKADQGKTGEDPLKLNSGSQTRITPPGQDPLKANEVPNGVDKLQVQEVKQ